MYCLKSTNSTKVYLKSMNANGTRKITIFINQKEKLFYSTLLQSGVEFESFQGESVGDFLCSLPGFSREYIENTVQTIFLEGSPVDNIDKVFTKDTHTLALSAAMPGLAGAILRRNSLHSSLRTETVDEEKPNIGAKTTIRLKVFNSIAQERGPLLLENGLLFNGRSLYKSLSIRHTLLEKARSIQCDGTDINLTDLFDILETNEKILLFVKAENDH